MGHFGHLAVREHRQGAGGAHQARVGGHHPSRRPDPHLVGMQGHPRMEAVKSLPPRPRVVTSRPGGGDEAVTTGTLPWASRGSSTWQMRAV